MGGRQSLGPKDDAQSYRRGEDDGRLGHPPAEATEPYLKGYSKDQQQQNEPHRERR